MCTAINLISQDGKHFFGRNLDASISFEQSVHIIPRQFEWVNIESKQKEISKYATIGMGIVVEKHPLLFDAVNEKGLAGAGLCFFNLAKFSDEGESGKINISASDLIYWVLSQYATIDEVKEGVENLVITKTPLSEELPVVPLHWIFTDLTGDSIVIEYTASGLQVYEDYIGVLTNDPTFPWHTTNLSQYVTLSSESPTEKRMGKVIIRPLGQGLGSFGIPGDGSSVSRFVRAVFFKNNISIGIGEVMGASAVFEVLSKVSVTKGSQVSKNGAMNYTIYQSAMCQETATYYYTDYGNHRINAVSLNSENITGKEIVNFKNPLVQDINYLN